MVSRCRRTCFPKCAHTCSPQRRPVITSNMSTGPMQSSSSPCAWSTAVRSHPISRAMDWSGMMRPWRATAPNKSRWPLSESAHHLRHVLDFGRRRKAVPDELAPFLKIRRAAEIDRVILHRLPVDEQPIARRLLDRAPQFHAAAALGALEDRRGLFHAGLEFAFHSGLDVDLGDFGNHASSLAVARLVRLAAT